MVKKTIFVRGETELILCVWGNNSADTRGVYFVGSKN